MSERNGSYLLQTDFYQWNMFATEVNTHDKEWIYHQSVMEFYIRKTPKNAYGDVWFPFYYGLIECLNSDPDLTEDDISYLREIIPTAPPQFFEELGRIKEAFQKLTILAVPQATACFTREPVIQIIGPTGLCHLLETIILNKLNYPSLVATYGHALRKEAGDDIVLSEFGLRRGPSSGSNDATMALVTTSFDNTSNVNVGRHLMTLGVKVPVVGTLAHSFITSKQEFDMSSVEDIPICRSGSSEYVNVRPKVVQLLSENPFKDKTLQMDELQAFLEYAQMNPGGLVLLIDSYDTLESGIYNFILVSKILIELGYKPKGLRIDSGDLAYQSKEIRKLLIEHLGDFGQDICIIASNDIDVDVIRELNIATHEINAFGIGTNAVCPQGSLGGVGKIVETSFLDKNGSTVTTPVIKISTPEKTTVPCKKVIYRLFGRDGIIIADVMALSSEPIPEIGKKVTYYDAQSPEISRPIDIKPSEVIIMLQEIYSNGCVTDLSILNNTKENYLLSKDRIREDMVRQKNATPAKVVFTEALLRKWREVYDSKKSRPLFE